MSNTDTHTACTSRPTLTDIDDELLRNIFVQETRYFQQSCNTVDGSITPLESIREENNSPPVKIAASLLRYGISSGFDFDIFLWLNLLNILYCNKLINVFQF